MSVGVVITTYNRAHLVGRAIDSVLAQGAIVEKIAIVDDASSDGTPDLLATYARRDPRIEIVRNACNLGPSASKNSGLDRVVGCAKALAFLDSDDWLHDGVLDGMFESLVRDEGVSQVLGYMEDGEGKVQGTFVSGSGHFSFQDAACGKPSGDFLRLTRSELLRHLRFNEKAWGGEGAMWLQLLKRGDGLVLERTVAVCDRSGGDRISVRLAARALDERVLTGNIWAGRSLLEVSGDAMLARCPERHHAVVLEAARWAVLAGDRSSCVFLAAELHRSGHRLEAVALWTLGAAPSWIGRGLVSAFRVAHRRWRTISGT